MNFLPPSQSHIFRIGWRLALLCVWCVLLCRQPQPVFAKPDFPPVVLSVYRVKGGGNVDGSAKSCKLCHDGAPPKLNAYGIDLKAALKTEGTKTLTPEALRAVEEKDSDADGFSNVVEFIADTLPADPNSKPKGAAPAQIGAGRGGNLTATPVAKAPETPGLWSPKTLLFPEHAQHPVLVHFPVALFIISLLFDVLGKLRRQPILQTAGGFNLLVAAIGAVPSLISGILAWQIKYQGVRLEGTLLLHLIMAIVTTLLLWTLWALRRQHLHKGVSELPNSYFIVAGLVFVAVSVTGHLGGGLTAGM